MPNNRPAVKAKQNARRVETPKFKKDVVHLQDGTPSLPIISVLTIAVEKRLKMLAWSLTWLVYVVYFFPYNRYCLSLFFFFVHPCSSFVCGILRVDHIAALRVVPVS